MNSKQKKAPLEQPPPRCPEGISDCPIAAQVATLQQEIARLADLVRTDTLTGLANYRFFIQALEHEIERTQRSGQATALIMLDIDHFKQVNDTWGHQVGNRALAHIAAILRQNVRRLDIPCRYGGEEFAIILPDTGLASASQVGERIRRAIAQTPLLNNGEELSLTVSLGIAIYRVDQPIQATELIAHADHYLYKAKQEGRNRVCHPEPEQINLVSPEEKQVLAKLFGRTKTEKDPP